MIGKLGQRQVTRPNDLGLIGIHQNFPKKTNQTQVLQISFFTNSSELALPQLDAAKLMRQIHRKLDRMAPSPHLNFYKRDIAKAADYHLDHEICHL